MDFEFLEIVSVGERLGGDLVESKKVAFNAGGEEGAFEGGLTAEVGDELGLQGKLADEV